MGAVKAQLVKALCRAFLREGKLLRRQVHEPPPPGLRLPAVVLLHNFRPGIDFPDLLRHFRQQSRILLLPLGKDDDGGVGHLIPVETGPFRHIGGVGPGRQDHHRL